ncbi:MAG: hypothetical protein PHV04_01765 [Clostridia bacterium]|nr:hypothetical protein [Clostridia bacterium]
MKKTKKIVLLIIMIALIVLPLASASAQCIHDSYYYDVSYGCTECYPVTSYQCATRTYDEYECKICGERWEITTSLILHDHEYSVYDLGTNDDGTIHWYAYICSLCLDTVIIYEYIN